MKGARELADGLNVMAVMPEKFKLDVWYVDHYKLWTDIQVIFITIKKVLMRKDINSATAATMEAFNGQN